MRPCLFRSALGLCVILSVLLGCSRAPFVEPGLPGQEPSPKRPSVEPKPSPEPTHADTAQEPGEEVEDDLDFALAFVDSVDISRAEPAVREAGPPPPGDTRGRLRKAVLPLEVPSLSARIALKRDVAEAVFYSLGEVDLRARGMSKPPSCRGRIAVEASKLVPGEAVVRAAGIGRLRVALPCTLLAHSRHNFFEFDEASYRGSIVIAPSRRTSVTVVNLLDVEDYLRGVVALEIGKRNRSEIEGVKAQAVAARTYAYRRIIERTHEPFDLLADVGDQVYGGVNAEDPLCDLALRQTENLVLVYDDSAIVAYYHSTCGGRTANIEDVWEKPPQPYLRSIEDIDSEGKAYCGISQYYEWDESWDIDQLSRILARFSRETFPDRPPVQGTVTGVTVRHTFACGRVGSVVVGTDEGSYELGGDKIRFVFRRNRPDYPILRSCRFSVTSADRFGVRLHGQGYGHGVGLCQMGAIGRARAGQSFRQILEAYYLGAQLTEVKQR